MDRQLGSMQVQMDRLDSKVQGFKRDALQV